MADLDTYKDKVIVFEAVKASDANRLATRQPLQPTNTQIPSSPRASSHKPAGIKPGLDGTLDENNVRPYVGTQSNTHSLPRSLDRISQPSRVGSHFPGSTCQSSTLPQASVNSRLTPHSGTTTPLSASDHASGSVDMAGFDRYYASWHDRVKVSYPDYQEGRYILLF